MLRQEKVIPHRPSPLEGCGWNVSYVAIVSKEILKSSQVYATRSDWKLEVVPVRAYLDSGAVS